MCPAKISKFHRIIKFVFNRAYRGYQWNQICRDNSPFNVKSFFIRPPAKSTAELNWKNHLLLLAVYIQCPESSRNFGDRWLIKHDHLASVLHVHSPSALSACLTVCVPTAGKHLVLFNSWCLIDTLDVTRCRSTVVMVSWMVVQVSSSEISVDRWWLKCSN